MCNRPQTDSEHRAGMKVMEEEIFKHVCPKSALRISLINLAVQLFSKLILIICICTTGHIISETEDRKRQRNGKVFPLVERIMDSTAQPGTGQHWKTTVRILGHSWVKWRLHGNTFIKGFLPSRLNLVFNNKWRECQEWPNYTLNRITIFVFCSYTHAKTNTEYGLCLVVFILTTRGRTSLTVKVWVRLSLQLAYWSCLLL